MVSMCFCNRRKRETSFVILGLLISSLCKQETSAMQIMAGSVYPVLLMSGECTPSNLILMSYAD